MNVLEIYPNDAWWFEAGNAEQLDRLRTAAQQVEDEPADPPEEQLPGRAFHMVGDAATFDLIPAVFDEIIVHYSPTALQRLNLEERMRTWIHAGGKYEFSPDFAADKEGHSRDEEYRPLSLYVK